MVNKAEIKCRFRRSVGSYEDNAPVQKKIADELFELLLQVLDYQPKSVLEIGCGTGLLTRKIKDIAAPEGLFVNDLVEEMCDKTAALCGLPAAHCRIGDIEELKLTEHFDLIVSASTFQWFCHPRETFQKLAEHLKEGGLMVFSTFGPDNMRELHPFTKNGLKYLSCQEITAYLSGSFDLLRYQQKHYKLYFAEPVEVLRHLKKTGVNASNLNRPWTKGTLQHFAGCYEKDLQIDAFPLTYHPLFFVCRKKR